METTPEQRFADCCAAGPLEIMIERDGDGTVIARGTLDQPFAIIGRDPFCDIHLNDPTVSLRHAFAQVIGGHLFVVDLSSTTGTHWPTGRLASGWLTPGEPLAIGPFRLYLTRSAALNPTVLAPDFHPLASTVESPGSSPRVVLEFRSGRTDHNDWEVNRVMTLVGRASECKLHLAGEEIALFHTCFVKTIAGLWMVDLLARGGTQVNGKKARVALISDGDELTIGKFAIGIRYPKPVKSPSSAEDSAISFDVPHGKFEEPIPYDSLALNSSARIGRPPLSAMPEIASLLEDEMDLAPLTRVPADHNAVWPLLRQMINMQGTMFDQFRQSLMMILKILGPSHGEAFAVVQTELTRLAELNAEMQKLNADIRGSSESLAPLNSSDSVSTALSPEESAIHQEDLRQRMELLSEERQGLWQRLIGKGSNRT